jgi:hypothetical protein
VDKAARLIAEDESGCDPANAAIELTEEGHPGLRVIEEFKMRQRDRQRLCKAAGASQPDRLADTLFLLIEGARVSRRSVGAKGTSANLPKAIKADAFCRGRRGGSAKEADASVSLPTARPVDRERRACRRT